MTKKIALACSNGGHLVEMLQIISAFNDHQIIFLTLLGEDTEDIHSPYKIKKYKKCYIHSIKLFFNWLVSIIKREARNLKCAWINLHNALAIFFTEIEDSALLLYATCKVSWAEEPDAGNPQVRFCEGH